MGMRKLLGMQGGNEAAAPIPVVAGQSTAQLESGLNDLERRSTVTAPTGATVMQARAAAATAQRKPY